MRFPGTASLTIKHKKLFLFFVFIFLPSLAAASDQYLDTCLKIAEARDRKLAVAEEQINLGKVRVSRSARNFFPFITAQRRFTRGKTVDTKISTVTIQGDAYEAEEIGLRGSLSLYEGGRLRAAYAYDRMMVDASKYNYTKAREELFFNVKLTYYEMLTLKSEYAALSKAFDDVDRLQNKVRIEYKAKAIAELDLIEAENFRDRVEDLLRASELNLQISIRKLLTLLNVDSMENIPALVPEALADDVPEITFTLEECSGFIAINNVDLKLNQLQIRMANEKKKINRSKVIPRFSVEGFYGQSGEAFVTEPLDLATVWSVMGRMNWSLWGNSFEVTQNSDKTSPASVTDVSTRIESSSLEAKLSFFDDMSYYVDAKESKVNFHQAQAEYNDVLSKNLIAVQKAYGEYANSLRNARTLRKEMTLKKRKLELTRKRNDLYEVPTVQLMEEAWKYAETISSFARSVYANYASVAELERLTLMPLR